MKKKRHFGFLMMEKYLRHNASRRIALSNFIFQTLVLLERSIGTETEVVVVVFFFRFV